MTGRQRLRAALWPPRVSRAQLIVALLLCVLGLGLAIQVRSTSDASVLRGARQEDLVRILDEIGDQTQRLQDEQQRLEEQRTELENSSDQAEEARRQTEQKEQQLGVLAGTVAAEGPGLTITVSAPQRPSTRTSCWTPYRSCGPPVPRRSRSTTYGWWRVRSSRRTATGSASTGSAWSSRSGSGRSVIRRIWNPLSTFPAVWCRVWKRSRPRWPSPARRRSSWTPCGRRIGLTTLGRHRSETRSVAGARAVRARGSPGACGCGGRSTARAVRGGNCLVGADVVFMSGSAHRVCNEVSSCPTGGSVSVKGNRP